MSKKNPNESARSALISRLPRCEGHPSATPGLATRHSARAFFTTMRTSSSECIWTVARRHRGHRIKAVQVGDIWHAMVHGHNGSIVKSIESTSLAEAMGQAEWVIETRLACRPPPQRERMAG